MRRIAYGEKYRLVILFVFLICGSIYIICQQPPKGITVSEREELLQDFPKGEDWKIVREETVENYIISGAVSRDGLEGLAVFKPSGKNGYRLSSRAWNQQGEVLITGAMIHETWYELIWFYGAETEYAEIVYTLENQEKKEMRHSSEHGEIFCAPAPDGSFSVHAVYYDSEGNQYE